MKNGFVLIILIFYNFFGYSQVSSKEIDFEKEARRKCFIIPIDSVQRELGRLYLKSFDSTFMKKHFSNQYPIVTIKFSRNGKIKKVIFEGGTILKIKKFKRITKRYLRNKLKYFNINYRDESNSSLKLTKTYLFINFDKNGKLVPKSY